MNQMLTVCFRKHRWITSSVITALLLLVIVRTDKLNVDKAGSGFKIIALEKSLLTTDAETKLEDSASSLTGTERSKIAEQICSTSSFPNASSGLPFGGRFLRHRSIYYCNLRKCGSTFMNIFLPSILECTGKCIESVLIYEQVKGKERTKEKLDNAYSFMFVREPYARLFSAYENKLFLPNEFWNTLGVDVVRSVRPGLSNENRTIGYDVTFKELVEHVLQFSEQGLQLNRHLIPMFEFCNPCKLKFNFIGKLETMSDDLVDLVEDWKVKEIVTKNKTSVTQLEAATVYKRAFGPYGHMFTALKMYRGTVSRYKLFQRAWSSYHIRGLILKTIEMPFQENEVANVNNKRYGTEIEKALDSSSEHEEALKAQREEALIQAYRSVPMDLMMRLRNFMKYDCLLFGYDDMPKKLFNRSGLPNSFSHNYYKGL